MKIYLKKANDNEFANHNFYAAYDGFKQMGFEMKHFYNVDELIDLQREDIIVGFVDDVRRALQKFDVIAPEIDYPEEVTGYLGRRVWKSRLSTIANNPENWNVFIKPIEDKKFTGIVVRNKA
ncbi:ATP-grasp domain-containing protein [Paenibacillus pinistramenti]|uniref:ATP-grasp domain-containing protein n=1 Tax=Paenibacillus pinistramenti TaxID=1768003 RepID=UPI001EF039B9|nr:ATP-grasp domain-containing protein [Paenibacillus pinistramenti]